MTDFSKHLDQWKEIFLDDKTLTTGIILIRGQKVFDCPYDTMVYHHRWLPEVYKVKHGVYRNPFIDGKLDVVLLEEELKRENSIEENGHTRTPLGKKALSALKDDVAPAVAKSRRAIARKTIADALPYAAELAIQVLKGEKQLDKAQEYALKLVLEQGLGRAGTQAPPTPQKVAPTLNLSGFPSLDRLMTKAVSRDEVTVDPSTGVPNDPSFNNEDEETDRSPGSDLEGVQSD